LAVVPQNPNQFKSNEIPSSFESQAVLSRRFEKMETKNSGVATMGCSMIGGYGIYVGPTFE
jgi:hypothetical protein